MITNSALIFYYLRDIITLKVTFFDFKLKIFILEVNNNNIIYL
jgi:hypothetical protein